ncbi:MAG: EthD family reductase, partial [Pirellulaceae bacterium]
MVRLTVLYGHPADPEAFQRYYRDVHVPLARKMKGLQGWTIGMCEST